MNDVGMTDIAFRMKRTLHHQWSNVTPIRKKSAAFALREPQMQFGPPDGQFTSFR
jgi:hypothetical protein